MQDKIQFKELLTLIGEKYEREISKAMGKTVWQALKPFSDSECIEALNNIIRFGRFYKDLLPDLLENLEGSKRDRGVEAWLELDQAVQRVGPYVTVQFSDPVIMSCVDAMGGWEELGKVTTNEWKWKRKEFETLYPIMARRGNHPEMLLGFCDRHNIGRGFKVDVKPLLIGDGRGDLLEELNEGGKEKL